MRKYNLLKQKIEANGIYETKPITPLTSTSRLSLLASFELAKRISAVDREAASSDGALSTQWTAIVTINSRRRRVRFQA